MSGLGVRTLEEKRTVGAFEERLWESVETISDGFAVFGRDRCLVTANSAWLDVFDPDRRMTPGLPAQTAFELAAGQGHIALEGDPPIQWAIDLCSRWDEASIPEKVIGLRGGRFIRLVDRQSHGGDIVCLAQDITAMRHREVQLTEACTNAEAVVQAQTAFFANMSHELRTPLNGVVSMAELMLETDLDDEQQMFLQTIKNSGDALLGIINDVLDLSKLEAERMVLHPEAFDLERLLHEVILLLQPTIRGKNLSLYVDYDLFLPTRLIADPGRLRQIVTNLVGNAIKFTSEGHVLIRVVGIEHENNAWHVHITVEDTGVGIPQDKLVDVFGVFSQVDQPNMRRVEGTGLGLAICRQLVTLMGGEIWVDSVLGEGSCFGFRLEFCSAEPRRATPKPIEPGLAYATVIGGGTVEQELLKRQLVQLGVGVQCFENGADAVASTQHPPHPQLIFLEDRLPDGSGLEIVPTLRRTAPRSAILVLASERETLRHKCSDIDAILPRPVLRSELFGTLAGLKVRDPTGPVQLPKKSDPPYQPLLEQIPRETGLRRMRVLVAEDNKTNQIVFQKMIKRLDLDVEYVGDGLTAVERFSAFRPDAVFMDISMPILDGKAATAEIRQLERGRAVPVVALTAHAQTGDKEMILASGMDHYLTKPFKKAVLEDMLHQLCPNECRPPAGKDALPGKNG